MTMREILIVTDLHTLTGLLVGVVVCSNLICYGLYLAGRAVCEELHRA